MMYCKRYPDPTCWDCGRTCKDDGGVPCRDWIPDRGAHPSTANPCELGFYDPDLCWADCMGCPNAPEEGHNAQA